MQYYLAIEGILFSLTGQPVVDDVPAATLRLCENIPTIDNPTFWCDLGRFCQGEQWFENSILKRTFIPAKGKKN